jgi:prepilin-type N-terminal cleavage/methylation domain-containing protein
MTDARKRGGFTLVELLVVIGIIALLIAMLMPALTRVRQQALSLKCKSQMRDVGLTLRIYSDEFRGVVFPIGPEFPNPRRGNQIEWQTLGYEPTMPDLGRSKRWPVPAFHIQDEYTDGTYDRTKPITSLPVTNPSVLICPNDVEPAENHTYILNKYLAVNTLNSVKLSGRVRDKGGNPRSDSDVVLMGEKRVSEPDYYMEADPATEFDRVVDPYKHGIKLGSNYLYKDGHVDIVPPKVILDGLDSWDPTGGVVIPPPATP